MLGGVLGAGVPFMEQFRVELLGGYHVGLNQGVDVRTAELRLGIDL